MSNSAQAYPKRLIEVDLPIARISAHARREKSIRHGHISTLHIWWARRPLAACRAVICAALWPDPADNLCPPKFRQDAYRVLSELKRRVIEGALSPDQRDAYGPVSRISETKDAKDYPGIRKSLLDFIAEFANWDLSTNKFFLEASRALTQSAHESLGSEIGTRPLVVDPFAGGGSIPLETLRVGADAFASDLNPVPVLLNKVVLEYIPKYGQRLADEVRKWGESVQRELKNGLSEFYPDEADGTKAVGYLWARTILSEAPGEDEVPIEVPVLRSMWLSSKPKRRYALRWQRDPNGRVLTETVRVRYQDGNSLQVRRPLLEVFQPSSPSEVENGTSAGGAATCPVTGFTTPVERVRDQLKARAGGAVDARLLCVVTTPKAISGRVYRLPKASDLKAVKAAETELQRRVAQHATEVSLVPDGKLNHLRGFFNVVLYGMTTWGDLFTPRQSLSLTHLVDLIKNVASGFQDVEFGAAVQTCLAMALDRCADKCASVVVWNIPAEKIEHVFGRQALPMVWDFAETNILSDIGWAGACEWVQKVVEHTARSSLPQGTATAASATAQPLPDDVADAVVTDPPYYAAIPYADLSDFFYSWLKRSVGGTHPDLFSPDLAPKEDECVQLSHRAAMYRHKDSSWFESMMTRACTESRRVAKPSGISVVVFANKETSGWEAMLTSLISSGWVITASWPIDTERQGRLRAMDSAALASSVHLVCRPRENPDGSLRTSEIGDWRDILSELPARIHQWMPRLAAEGVVGADAIFACIGPALEVFSRYGRVEKSNGDVVPLREYLEHVWAAVSHEALTMIFKDAEAAGLEPDARLTAMWLWTLNTTTPHSGHNGSDEQPLEETEAEESDGGKQGNLAGFVLEFDAARKIAQGLGIHLERIPSVVEVKGDKARLLPVAERTRALFGKDATDPATAKRKPRKKDVQMSLFAALQEAEASENIERPELKAPQPGSTVLDRVHQAMILFAAGRGEALKRFLVEEGAGKDGRFWKLAQSLSALYPAGIDEKRWVDGVLARKKGLGL